MFKSKLDFNAFDRHNDKVKDLEMNQVQAQSKSSVKKMKAKPDVKTDFHLIDGYFKNEQGKVLGGLVDFGFHKKLTKHFLQVEMKPGKPNKRMSDSPKHAATGQSFVTEEGGKKVLCFEPHPASKIPNGKWPKILKSLKAYFAGLKTKVILDGTVIEEEAPQDDITETPLTEDNTTEESSPEQPVTDTTEEEATAAAPKDLKTQVESIVNGLKKTLPKEIVPRMKSRSVEPNDAVVVEDLLGDMQAFKERFETLQTSAKNKIQQVFDVVERQYSQVERIYQTIQDLLDGNTTVDPTETENTVDDIEEDTSLLEELLQQVKDGIGSFDKIYKNLKKDLEDSNEEPIVGGDQFLENIA